MKNYGLMQEVFEFEKDRNKIIRDFAESNFDLVRNYLIAELMDILSDEQSEAISEAACEIIYKTQMQQKEYMDEFVRICKRDHQCDS